jgi:hypothetical protein
MIHSPSFFHMAAKKQHFMLEGNDGAGYYLPLKANFEA